MKKIMNKPENIIQEMLQGIEFACPDVKCFPSERVITRRNKKEKVGLVSGGGSGHEPAHGGYVGYGMLDAVVAGNVFASPSPDQMLKGIEEANTGKGVLFILKNYTGDKMNFAMAKDFAENEGIEVESVVVKDDVAVPDEENSAGRRGIAGTVLVHKCAGAKAEQGATLLEVKAVAEKAIARVRTMGISMSSCTLPGLSKPSFFVAEDEIEIGMGIHGEAGIEKSPMKNAEGIAEILLMHILHDYDYTGKEVAVLINGLGGTSLMELYVLANEIHKLFLNKGIKPIKTFVGNYMTSLEMAGCSLSLLELDDELKECILAPCNTAGLTIC